jgi:MarR family
MDLRDRDGGTWTLLTGHGRVLVEIARNSRARVRDIAAAAGLAGRTVQAIIADLEAAGYLSRSTWSCCAWASAACCQASAAACQVRRSWLLTSRGAVACARSPWSTWPSSAPRLMARSSACSSAISSARTVSRRRASNSGSRCGSRPTACSGSVIPRASR